MRKIVLFAAILAILGAYGCNEDNVYMPDVNTDGRVIGSVHGVVLDGASHDALAGVEVSTAVRGTPVSTVSDATGHYAFTNLDPGTYVLTFVFPTAQTGGKDVKSAYTSVKGEVDIPTLESLSGIMDVPTDQDFHYEAEGDVEMFPLDGSAEGYVYVQTDMQTMVPAEGVNVVADFIYPSQNTNDLYELEIMDEEWFATTDEDGHYMFTGLPTGTMGVVRSQHYLYGDMAFDPQSESLNLSGGGNALVEPIIFDGTTSVYVMNQNWNGNVPFPVDGSFVATFSVPMDPSTFVATLNGYSKTLVPITVTWDGNTVTITPDSPLVANEDYMLTMSGWSMDGQAFTQHNYLVTTSEVVPPSIVDTNFEGSQTFPIDGNLEITFNMPMDPSTIVVWFNENKLGNIVFDTSWNEDYTQLTIDPVVDLDYDYPYEVRVEGNGANGEPLATTGWIYFDTIRLQNVIVVDTNFMADFDNTADLWWNFSEPMDPAGFEITMNGGGQVAFADPVWSNGNTTVTIDPYLDLDMGVYYTVTMDGKAASGQDFHYNKTYRTSIGDAPFIVQTNIVDGEFPVDGNIEVQFNKPMDSDTVEVAFNGAGPNPLYGAITWTDDMNMVFNPDAQLLPSQGYSFNVQGYSQDGGFLNTTINFNTIGGIEAVWNNIMQQDGGYDDFPVDGAIQFRFSLPVNLDAPNTSITLYRAFPTMVPVLVHSTLSEDNYLLTITPDQTLALDTDYDIVFTVGSDLLNDTTSGDITFHTEVTPPSPVAQVTNFVLDPAWDGNYDETSVHFTWDRDANATEYYIYARNQGAAKDDFLRVTMVPQQGTDTISGTADLAASAVYQEYFDTRDTDTPQTPFDGRDVIFKVTAVNSLGEGTDSAEFAVSDVYAPTGAFTGQDVSADDSAAPDGEDNIVVVTFAADEYLDAGVTPVVTVTENDLSVNDWGDPNYTPTVGEITFEDMDGFTNIYVEIVVADGMNGAGDYVAIDGFQDTSGNPVDVVTTPIAPYQLTDSTAPTGAFAAAAQEADNSLGATDVDFTWDFTATELLDETVVPTVTITDGGISDVMTYLGTYTYSVVGGVSVVSLDMRIPAGANARDDFVTIDGLTDLAGNTMDAAVDSDPLVDTAAPGGSWTGQSASADNAAGGSDITVTATFTSNELLDSSVAPTFTIADGGYAGLAVDADNVVFTDVGNVTTVDFDVTIPAGANAMDDTLSVNGLTDVSGNAQTVAVTWALLDLTAPATPTGLVVTSADGDDATGAYDVVLDWTASTEADLASYEVFRDGASLGTVAAGTETFTDSLTGEADGNTHDYTLTAIDNAANASAPTAAVTATMNDNTAPATPTGLVVTSANGDDATGIYDVVLDWTASPESDLQGYEVFRGGVSVGTVPAGTETFTDTAVPGAADGGSALYTLVAGDLTGNTSDPTAAVTANFVDNTAPAVPAGLVVTSANGDDATGTYTVILNWTANTESDLQGYEVFRDGASVGTIVGNAFTDVLAGDAAGNTHDYTVTAGDVTGNTSAQTTPVTATLTDNVAPAAPLGLTASNGAAGEIVLTWTANTEADLQGYGVFGGNASGTYNLPGSPVAIGAGTETYTFTGLTTGTTYYFNILAADNNGNNSAQAGEISFVAP